MNSFQNVVKKIRVFIFLLYIYAFGIVLPLYYNDKYFDMMSAKAILTEQILKVLIVPLVLLFVYQLIKKRKEKKSIIFYVLFIFGISIIVSTVLAQDISNSIFGHKGWYIGLLVIESVLLAVYDFYDIKIENKKIFIPLLICIFLVNLIAVFHSFEIDILGIHENILEVSYHKFLTTIGNINWYTGYLCLVVPFVCSLYILAESQQFYLFPLAAISVITVSFLGSDGIYLGLGFVSFFFVPFVFETKERLRRFSILLLIFVLGLFIARQLMYCMDGYSGELRRLAVILPLLLVGVILLLFSKIIKENLYLKISKYIILVVELALIAAVIIFVIVNVAKNSFEWTTGRILLWNDSLKIFFNFETKEKLFGIGLENLYLIYGPISERYKANYLSSHSEWIQLLLTGGFINFVIYLLFWFVLIRSYLKNKHYKKEKLIPFYMSFFCYLGQTFVNSATVCNVMMFSILLIIYIQNTTD